jgi:hypothetical protein
MQRLPKTEIKNEALILSFYARQFCGLGHLGGSAANVFFQPRKPAAHSTSGDQQAIAAQRLCAAFSKPCCGESMFNEYGRLHR